MISLAKLKNLLLEKENLIKTLKYDAEVAEKKYLDSLKEKEGLKSKLELNIKNNTRKASLIIGNTNGTSENENLKEKELFKGIHSTRNKNNLQNNLLNNFKNNALSRNNKKNKTNSSFKNEFNESDEDDVMNNTININSNQKNFSNFAMFNNNNLTSRNQKVIFFH